MNQKFTAIKISWIFFESFWGNDNVNFNSRGKGIIGFSRIFHPPYLDPFVSIGVVLHKIVKECRRKDLKETKVCPVEYGRDKHIILPPHNQSKQNAKRI